MVGLAIVVPGADAEERGIGPQKRRSGVEVLEEIGSDFEVVLWMRSCLGEDFENDDLVVLIGDEHLIQEPTKVAGQFVVAAVSWKILLQLTRVRSEHLLVMDVTE